MSDTPPQISTENRVKWENAFKLIEIYAPCMTEGVDEYLYAKSQILVGYVSRVKKAEYIALRSALLRASHNADAKGDKTMGFLFRQIAYHSDEIGMEEYAYLKDKYGGCYIATAVYGSYNSPEVHTLRSFRDNYLEKRIWGQYFVKFYYKYSPHFADRISPSSNSSRVIRVLLNKFVNKISNKY